MHRQDRVITIQHRKQGAFPVQALQIRNRLVMLGLTMVSSIWMGSFLIATDLVSDVNLLQGLF